MKTYSFLILTDHNTHTHKDSTFNLTAELLRDPRTKEVYTCSRGDRRNIGFYYYENAEQVYAFETGEDYCHANQDEHIANSISINPEEFDIIFFRVDPPIPEEFLKWLGTRFSNNMIINSAITGWETSSKEFLVRYPELVPGVCLIETIEDVERELDKYAIVLKPLKRFAGNGLIRLSKEKGYFENTELDIKDVMLLVKNILEEENLIAMKYLKNVKNGDKRIVVVNGKILGGILRKPQPDSWLCNTDKGGLPVISNITPEEEKICVIVNKDLAEKGQVIYGIDTLEDDDGTRILSEINTVNAGGLHELYEVDENLYQTVVQSIYDYIIARFKLQSEVML